MTFRPATSRTGISRRIASISTSRPADAEPKVQRLRFTDRQIETITSLKDLRRVDDWIEGDTDQRRAGWLPGLHSRHRLPGNLRAHRPLAVTTIRRGPGAPAHRAAPGSADTLASDYWLLPFPIPGTIGYLRNVDTKIFYGADMLRGLFMKQARSAHARLRETQSRPVLKPGNSSASVDGRLHAAVPAKFFDMNQVAITLTSSIFCAEALMYVYENKDL